jgi:hypothetical protein
LREGVGFGDGGMRDRAGSSGFVFFLYILGRTAVCRDGLFEQLLAKIGSALKLDILGKFRYLLQAMKSTLVASVECRPSIFTLMAVDVKRTAKQVLQG